MTELNSLIMERTAQKVLTAIENEKLMYKEAAEILGFSQTYLSSIKRSDAYKHVPRKAWEIMHEWAQTGKTLEEYKCPQEDKEETVPLPFPEPSAAPAVPKVKYILTRDPEPKKRGPKPDPEKMAAAQKKREQYEAGRNEKSYTKTIEINPVTGVHITIEVTIKSTK